MRFSPAAIALSLTFAMLSSAGLSKKSDDQINPLSISLMQKGDAAVKASNIEDAVGWYETALAVDPRNRAAYISMARVVKSKGLNGKAIRFYKEALELDPNDQTAIAEQADAMIAKGAIDQAKNSLARLKMLCRSNCANADKLNLAINEAGKKPVIQASAVTIKPIVGETELKSN